jgi:hypothetical protein
MVGHAMAKIGLAVAILVAVANGAAAEDVTVTKSILACVTGEAYGKFSRDVQESGNARQALANAVLSHKCRLFDAGTMFVIEKTPDPVLVRVHVKGSREIFWTSRLFLN